MRFFKYRVLPILCLYTVLFVIYRRYGSDQNLLSPVSMRKFPAEAADVAGGGPDLQTCEIHDPNPWDPSIHAYVTRSKLRPCRSLPKASYTEDDVWLVFKGSALASAVDKNFNCSYRAVLRRPQNDDKVDLGPPVSLNLTARVRMTEDFVRVSCYVGKSIIYNNYHTFVPDRKSVNQRMAAHQNDSGRDHWNVLLLGTDCLSRGAAQRYLVRTRKFLLNELNATEFLGYTKVGENTYNNMVPFLTGWHKGEIQKGPKMKFDYMPLLFKNYTAAGYTTFFGEDMPWGSLFNYLLPGFKEPPTDYYYHPLALSVKSDLSTLSWKGCERNGITNRIIMHYLKQFITKYKESPFFAKVYHSEMSHDNILPVRRLDEMYAEALEYFKKLGIFNNTFVFAFSDHGPRHGNFVKTRIGKIESRIPFMSIAVPEAFAKKHPTYMDNMRINSRRLTTHFDTYRTLLDILDQANHKEDPIFPKGRSLSLFSPIPRTRTCMIAGIPLIFCACYTEKSISVTSDYVKTAAGFLVDEINDILRPSSSVCEKLELDTIASAVMYSGKSVKGTVIGRIYKLHFFTKPGHGEFIGVVQVQKEVRVGAVRGAFKRHGEISRVNRYGNTSLCVTDREHRLLCYCKIQVSANVATTTTK